MKTCKADGCVNRVFGGGYCSWHQRLRQDKKAKKIPVRSTRTHVKDFSFGFDNQVDLFEHLWNNAKNEKGEVFCPFTGEKLNRFYNTDQWLSCFLHILCKKNWPYFKLNPDNVVPGFPEFHRIVDSGTFKERSEHPQWKWDRWDALVIEMKQKYQNFKKQNLLA